MSKPDLAVLIDAENVSGARAEQLFRKLNSLGRVVVCRAYGDFTNGASENWAGPIASYGILSIHQPSGGKNAADIALAIDAMDLLHAPSQFDFCIVSSDSDFTRLAIRLREAGRNVIGFGEGKARESFQNACSRFELLDTARTERPAQQSKPARQTVAEGRVPDTVRRFVITEISQRAGADGAVMLSVLSNRLKEQLPAFDLKKLKARSLSVLLDRMDEIELINQNRACRLKRAKQ